MSRSSDLGGESASLPESVREGIAQAERGELVDLGSFAQYADDSEPRCDQCENIAVGGDITESGDILWCADHAPIHCSTCSDSGSVHVRSGPQDWDTYPCPDCGSEASSSDRTPK